MKGAEDAADQSIGEIGSWVVEGVSGTLPGLLHKLVALAEVPSRLLSIGETGSCKLVDAAVARRGKAIEGAVNGGESNLVSRVGTGTRETFLSEGELLAEACALR